MELEVDKMWLMENGQQLVIQTMDSALHKCNIINNDAYDIVDSGDGGLIFIIDNSAREFSFSTKFA